MQDDLQAFRIQQMDKCFDDFQIPCRWVPDAGYAYGYPQFNYYPPFVYYLGALIHRLGFQYIDTVKILFVLGYLFSALAMFYLVKRFTKPHIAFVSAIIFSYVPYKALEVYVRGAMSEFWAIIFFPLIFAFIYDVIVKDNRKHIAYLALSIAGLLTTHMLSAFMLLIPAVIWGLYWIYIEKKWKKLGFLIISAVLGLSLSAFYVLPVIFERQFAHMETLLMGYFDWRKHFVGLFRLLLSREWGYGSSGFPDEKLNISTGLIQWIGAIVAAIIALFSIKRNKKVALAILTLIFSEAVILFLIHPRSNIIWEKITALQWLQFPWRFLAVSIFLLSLIVGLGLSLLSKKAGLVFGVLLVVSAIILNINFFKPKEYYQITDAEKFSGKLWDKQLTISIFDYLPIYAKLPPVSHAPEKPEILDGRVETVEYSKGSNYQTGKLVVYEDATIRLPLFDFPGMAVYANGEQIEHINDDCRNQEFCLGLITFKLPKGEFSVYTTLTDTLVRKLGNYLTIISLVAVLFVMTKHGKNKEV